MNTQHKKVIKTIKTILNLLIPTILKPTNVKQRQPERLELKGVNGTKVILELLVPIDELEPQAQDLVRVMKQTDTRSVKS